MIKELIRLAYPKYISYDEIAEAWQLHDDIVTTDSIALGKLNRPRV